MAQPVRAAVPAALCSSLSRAPWSSGAPGLACGHVSACTRTCEQGWGEAPGSGPALGAQMPAPVGTNTQGLILRAVGLVAGGGPGWPQTGDRSSVVGSPGPAPAHAASCPQASRDQPPWKRDAPPRFRPGLPCCEVSLGPQTISTSILLTRPRRAETFLHALHSPRPGPPLIKPDGKPQGWGAGWNVGPASGRFRRSPFRHCQSGWPLIHDTLAGRWPGPLGGRGLKRPPPPRGKPAPQAQ